MTTAYPPEPIPLYGCPTEAEAYACEGMPAAKYGALWPKYIVACPTCGVEYEWCGAHFESGAHYTCDGCCGWPFCSCSERHTGPCRVRGR